MKILYHHRTASRDGQEVHITELIAALRELGHEVAVVSPSGDDGAAGDGAMGGHRGGLARLRAIVPDALMPLASRAYEIVFTRRLVAVGRGLGVDFVYERHALDNRVGRRASRRLGVPFLLEVNSPLAREEAAVGNLKRLGPALHRELETLKSADAVLVVTHVLKEILVADGVAAERIHVIPNGIAPSRFLAPRDVGAKRRIGLEDRVVLGFIGFPRPWHGLDRVVKALAREARGRLKDAVLLLGGEGPALNDLLAQARALGIADRVRVHGVLSRADVPSFIDAFDVALQPHATEYASPLKLFEYMARGVAVVAPRQPNLTEVLTGGESAVLFEPGDDASFAGALCDLVADDDLRARVGEGGRRRLLEGGYTWPRNAERVVEIARSLR